MTVGADGVDAPDEDAIERGASKGSRFLQALNPRLLLAEMQDHVRKTIPIYIFKMASAMLLHRRIRTKANAKGVYSGDIESPGSQDSHRNRSPRI